MNKEDVKRWLAAAAVSGLAALFISPIVSAHEPDLYCRIRLSNCVAAKKNLPQLRIRWLRR
ncbi:MAG: hypothetical protein COV48_16755 [Elusimicrobia bacterium CG11_big_fil_rev_8_21_14_0_20_64_6]|nr:MAG: hypothetical protein COV48_16755 [Elusimicrobia bacterium CG11_big_fil_rev_8_21_14_0_20_64_6]